MRNKLSPKDSDYKKQKTISLLITAMAAVLLIYILFFIPISNPSISKEKSQTENIITDQEDNVSNFIPEEDILEDSMALNIEEPKDIVKEDTLKKDTVEENTKKTEKVVEKITPVKKDKIVKSKPENKEQSVKPKVKKEEVVKKNNKRSIISHVPGVAKQKGTLPKNKCNASGIITFFYTVNKEGVVIKAWKKSGTANTCLEKTGIEWIKQHVKLSKGTKDWTGVYTITFKK